MHYPACGSEMVGLHTASAVLLPPRCTTALTHDDVPILYRLIDNAPVSLLFLPPPHTRLLSVGLFVLRCHPHTGTSVCTACMGAGSQSHVSAAHLQASPLSAAAVCSCTYLGVCNAVVGRVGWATARSDGRVSSCVALQRTQHVGACGHTSQSLIKS